MTARRTLFAGIDKLEEAEIDATTARVRLADTIDEIQARLAPSQLFDDAIDGIRTRSADLAETASDVVRDRPGTVAASAAGVALLLARRPIARLARRIFSRK
jgi:ElaB/YqjD/DUF883 family membrane-anchored ribosome-binding protein